MDTQSSTLQRLLQEKRGYRNNDWGNNRIWVLEEVAYHEMTEMFNTDIPIYLNRAYGASIYLDQTGSFDDEAFEVEAVPCYEEVLSFIRQKMGTDKLFAIWLTTQLAVLNHYDSGEETPVSTYVIPEDAMVISDLGDEGCLFVIKIHPDELNTGFEIFYLNAVHASANFN